MVKSLYLICWSIVKKKFLLFFLVKKYIKKVLPLNIFPSCSPQQECAIAALQSFPHMKRFFWSRQIKYTTHKDIPALRYFGTRSTQRLEGLWNYCLKIIFQKLIFNHLQTLLLLGSGMNKLRKALPCNLCALVHGYNQGCTNWHQVLGMHKVNSAAHLFRITFCIWDWMCSSTIQTARVGFCHFIDKLYIFSAKHTFYSRYIKVQRKGHNFIAFERKPSNPSAVNLHLLS